MIFLNTGTDTAPLQAAWAAMTGRGEPAPRIVLCLHENVALAAAHPYFAVTGKPQAVMVHVDVGTQNLGSALHNAARAEAGVVIIAGRTPITAHGELAGGRDTGVHWMQDVPKQVGIVRQYVKWVGDLDSHTAVRTVRRAIEVAGAGIPGPVYLTAARETLMKPAKDADLPDYGVGVQSRRPDDPGRAPPAMRRVDGPAPGDHRRPRRRIAQAGEFPV